MILHSFVGALENKNAVDFIVGCLAFQTGFLDSRDSHITIGMSKAVRPSHNFSVFLCLNQH